MKFVLPAVGTSGGFGRRSFRIRHITRAQHSERVRVNRLIISVSHDLPRDDNLAEGKSVTATRHAATTKEQLVVIFADNIDQSCQTLAL